MKRSSTATGALDASRVTDIVKEVIAAVKQLDPTWLPSAPAALAPYLEWVRGPLFTGREEMGGVQRALEGSTGQELNEVLLRLAADDSSSALEESAASGAKAAPHEETPENFISLAFY